MGAVTDVRRVKARISANKSVAYPTDPSERSSFVARGLSSSEEWSSLGGAGGARVSAFQWKVYDLVKQASRSWHDLAPRTCRQWWRARDYSAVQY